MKTRTVAFFALLIGGAIFAATYGFTYWLLTRYARKPAVSGAWEDLELSPICTDPVQPCDCAVCDAVSRPELSDEAKQWIASGDGPYFKPRRSDAYLYTGYERGIVNGPRSAP